MQHSCKKTGMAAHTCNPSTMHARDGKNKGFTSSGSNERIFLTGIWCIITKLNTTSFSSLYTHICIHLYLYRHVLTQEYWHWTLTHRHTCVHTHTFKILKKYFTICAVHIHVIFHTCSVPGELSFLLPLSPHVDLIGW